MEIKTQVIGQMDNSTDGTFDIANRVYSRGGQCPTITTGGNVQPKTIKKIRNGNRNKTSN